MKRATNAEIATRVEVIVPLILDGFLLREIRLLVANKTTWGGQISEAQLKRYVAKAQEKVSSSAQIDFPREFATAKLRYERALARAAAAKDNKAYIAANKGLCELLGLKDLARLEHGGEVDIVALRKKLEDEVAEALAEDEADADS